ncbi:CoA pyrophosphatase [uncultured Acetobacteroides sp.]|uniref:NUDIX hydrolase n=1 Tax=uncultured Acetobacteroides sp. TaxID=1760811 RepID=UPI0029F464B1|nr:CoA pyrophosphatase [uncultured Acetobacteroides sp.]
MRLIQLKKILEKYNQDDLEGGNAHILAFPKFRLELFRTTKPTEKTKKSAVLILFYEKNEEVYFCLIKRPTYEGHHSGQVAFPGGKFEVKDESLRNTALREANEEVGIDIGRVDIVNELTTIFIPVSDFTVKPYIATTSLVPIFHPESHEVDYIIEAKLSDLMNSQLVEVEINLSKEKSSAPAYIINNENIWGGTAMILTELKLLLESNHLV